MGLPYCHYYFFHFPPLERTLFPMICCCSVAQSIIFNKRTNLYSTDVDCVPAGYGSPLVLMLLLNFKRILLATLRSWFGVFFPVTRGLSPRQAPC